MASGASHQQYRVTDQISHDRFSNAMPAHLRMNREKRNIWMGPSACVGRVLAAQINGSKTGETSLGIAKSPNATPEVLYPLRNVGSKYPVDERV